LLKAFIARKTLKQIPNSSNLSSVTIKVNKCEKRARGPGFLASFVYSHLQRW
jgi:hypothetical protein